MQQALHIFRKDVRYLYREITLVLLSAAIFAWKDPWWVDFLYVISAALLIGRAIHAEAIPGDRQFWITRPYRWQSLAAAKLMFILLFVNGPIFLDQLMIIARDSFPFASIWPGLLWSQVLWIFCFSLPVAALAAVTSGLMPFVFSSLTAVLLALSVPQLIMPQVRLLSPMPRPEMVEWIRNSAGIAAILAIALVILREQYRHRRTLFSRVFGLLTTLAGAAAFLYVPWSLGFAVQTHLRRRPAMDLSMPLAFGPGSIRTVQKRWNEQVPVQVPLTIQGSLNGLEVRPDALQLAFRRPNGQSWDSLLWNTKVLSTGAGVTKLEATAMMPISFFDDARKETLSLRGSLYFTLFETAPPKTVALTQTPVNVGDGLQCYRGPFNDIYCRSAFRWPGRLIYAKVFQSDLNSFYNLISYSPFPAVLDLDPIETHWATGGAASDRNLTLVIKKPVATFRRDLEINGVRWSAE